MNKCLHCYQPVEQGIYHQKCAKNFFLNKEIPELPWALNEMEELAKKIVLRSIAVTGVQAKLSLDIQKTDKQMSPRFTIVDLWGRFILKPPTAEYPELPEVEDCTMQLAHHFGLQTVPRSLIKLRSGELAYITRRIDREDKTGDPLHMEDFCQLSDKLTEEKYRGSLEKAANVIQKYSTITGFDLLTFFEINLFSFLTGNADMHLKNFSLIHNRNNMITLAPAYDLVSTRLLIPASQDKEETALTLNGKKNKINLDDFLEFGKNIGLNNTQLKNTFKKFRSRWTGAKEVINSSFLSAERKEKFACVIEERAQRLEIK